MCVYVCTYIHLYDRSLLKIRHTPQSVNTPEFFKCVCICVYIYIHMIGLFWHLDILHRVWRPRENVLRVCVYVCICIHLYDRPLLTIRHTPQSVKTPGNCFICVYICICIYICIYMIGLFWQLDILHRVSILREFVLHVCICIYVYIYMYIYIYIYIW